jgi:hypothetical protein
MFKPTHLLVSRSKQTPVHLLTTVRGFALVTEAEWQQNQPPAFEIRSKLGFFCHGTPVLGYSLQPLTTKTSQEFSPLFVTNA